MPLYRAPYYSGCHYTGPPTVYQSRVLVRYIVYTYKGEKHIKKRQTGVLREESNLGVQVFGWTNSSWSQDTGSSYSGVEEYPSEKTQTKFESKK